MIALIDENISHKVAAAARILDLQAVHVLDPNGPGRGTEDTAIFAWLGAKGEDWVFITQDINQTRTPRELQLMRSHRLAVFLLRVKTPPSLPDMGTTIIGNWAEMELRHRLEGRPFIYTFRPKKAMKLLDP